MEAKALTPRDLFDGKVCYEIPPFRGPTSGQRKTSGSLCGMTLRGWRRRSSLPERTPRHSRARPVISSEP
jgi:hypothetical protein